jgi:hypothetical protein
LFPLGRIRKELGVLLIAPGAEPQGVASEFLRCLGNLRSCTPRTLEHANRARCESWFAHVLSRCKLQCRCFHLVSVQRVLVPDIL